MNNPRSRFAVLLLVTLALGTRWLSAETPSTKTEPPGRSLIEVSSSVVMVQNDRGSNITCIALESGLYFVDTGLSTELATDFRNAMEKRYDKPTAGLILTHMHLDHFLAMGAFSDVPVVAASAGRPLMDRQLAIEWTDQNIAVYNGIFPTFAEDIVTARPFSPTVWVDTEIQLGTSDSMIVFRNTGGHSSCSSFVHFPAESVLIAGDLVQSHKRPYFGDATNDLPTWIDTLKLWNSMDVAKVCPGHGPVENRAYLESIWTYFEEFQGAVRKLKESGVSLQEAVQHTDFPDGYWPSGDEVPGWWPYCIARVYNAL